MSFPYKMEEMQEDAIYFVLKSNLKHRLDIDLKKNSMRNDDRSVLYSNIKHDDNQSNISGICLNSGAKSHLNTSSN